MPSPVFLIRQAAAFYDAPDQAPLRELAKTGCKRGFTSGGAWMRTALTQIRGGAEGAGGPSPAVPFQRLGLSKYAVSLTGGGMLAGLSGDHGPLVALALFGMGFYGLESPHVFLFPAAMDGSDSPWQASRALVKASGGYPEGFLCVVGIALVMLFGGLCGQGFVRSWCLGCLAVLFWYEKARQWQRVSMTTEEGAAALLDLGNTGPVYLRPFSLTCQNWPPARLVWLTDFHWHGGSTSRKQALVEILEHVQPDAILCGGDYADTKAGVALFGEFVRHFSGRIPVVVIPGNHDRWLGYDLLRGACTAGGGLWLDGGIHLLPVGGGVLPLGSFTSSPKPDHALPFLNLLHDPADWDAASLNAPLTLAGHLHGSQVTLWTREGRSFPGAWFYKYNGLAFTQQKGSLLVSRGLSDTIPLRWRTPREIILLEIQPE